MTSSLLAIPNISEGARSDVIAAVRAAYENAGALVLDETSDEDHGRSVHTLAGSQAVLSEALVEGWKVCSELIDLRVQRGVHPHVGAMDVAPVVFLEPEQRGAACASALTAAASLGRAGASVFLYGHLAGGRTRAFIRKGGLEALRRRSSAGELTPDFGPRDIPDAAGAVLVAARPPLIAFNLRLEGGESLAQARETAQVLREGGSHGLDGVKALAFELDTQGFVQLSFNLEDPETCGLDRLVEAVRERHKVASGELIGLTLSRYIESIPSDLAMPAFDPVMKSVEGCLRFHGIET